MENGLEVNNTLLKHFIIGNETYLVVLNKTLHGGVSGKIFIHPHWKQFPPLTPEVYIVLGVIALLMAVTSAFGNMLVISLFLRYRSMRTPSNVLILNLAVADLILSLGTLPSLGIASLKQTWLYGESGCLLYGFIGSVASIVSIVTLTMIAIERSCVITFSRKITPKKLIVLIQFIWIYGIFWATMPLVGWGRYIIEGSQISCTFDFLSQETSYKSFVLSLQTCVFYIPVSLIVFSYASIFVKVSRHERKMERLKQIQQLLRSGRFNRETKVAKSALLITLVFCLSWLPYAVVAMIGSFGNIQLITPLTSAIPGFCAKLSTSINPLIYVLFHAKYRSKVGKDFRSMVRCVRPST